VTLSGAIPHVAGLFTLVAVGLAGVTVFRRYEMLRSAGSWRGRLLRP